MSEKTTNYAFNLPDCCLGAVWGAEFLQNFELIDEYLYQCCTGSAGGDGTIEILESGQTVAAADAINFIGHFGGCVTDEGGGLVTIDICCFCSGTASGAPVGEGHITIFPPSYNSIGQGTWEESRSENAYYDWYWKNETSKANGDNVSFKVFLDVGTYTLMLIHHKNTDAGIVDISIDGVEVDSIDLYAALTWNVRSIQTGITISSSGLKTLKLEVDGKNASSSNYKYYMVYLALWRTA